MRVARKRLTAKIWMRRFFARSPCCGKPVRCAVKNCSSRTRSTMCSPISATYSCLSCPPFIRGGSGCWARARKASCGSAAGSAATATATPTSPPRCCARRCACRARGPWTSTSTSCTGWAASCRWTTGGWRYRTGCGRWPSARPTIHRTAPPSPTAGRSPACTPGWPRPPACWTGSRRPGTRSAPPRPMLPPGSCAPTWTPSTNP